jgi:hypothetical protein
VSRRDAGVPLGFGASDELLHVGEVSYEAKHRERKKGCAMVVVTVVGKNGSGVWPISLRKEGIWCPGPLKGGRGRTCHR